MCPTLEEEKERKTTWERKGNRIKNV